MSILPIVSPAHNAEGIALMPLIKAIYPFALDEGGVNPINCFLVKKITSLGTNTTELVAVKVASKRIQLTSESEFTGFDYGDDAQAGLKYRSVIEITPAAQLTAHSEYSVILSKDLAKNSVFDVKPANTNTGTSIPLVKGPYTGLINDTYRINITVSGNEGAVKYTATRLSDNHVITGLIGKKRFIEIEKGLFIKFDTGSYNTGDFFTIAVKPIVKTNEIYSWDFKTADSSYTIPIDQNSGVIIGLPLEETGPVITDPGSGGGTVFKLLSVSPSYGSVMNSPTNRTVTFTFNKEINPTSVTASTIKILVESTIDTYYGSVDFTHEVQGTKLIINFQ